MKIHKCTSFISMGCIIFAPFAFGQDKADVANTIVENFNVTEESYEKDFSGHRIGIGLGNASYLDDNTFVFDYGYEFNRYLGFILSASQYDEYVTQEIEGVPLTVRLDGVYTRVGVDIGYTFDFKTVDIKPYVVAGILYLNESNTLSNNSEIALQYGLGLRATIDKGIYIDASYRNADLDNWSGVSDKRDGQEALLTIGYKF